jgi:hypothetical protein
MRRPFTGREAKEKLFPEPAIQKKTGREKIAAGVTGLRRQA